MSTAGGQGAANDATAIARDAESATLRAALAELDAEASTDEIERAKRRTEIAHRLHEQERQVEGSPAHTAHVEMLHRLAADADAALLAAQRAQRRAQEHLDGATAAVTAAEQACERAREALAEAGENGHSESDGTSDGSAVL